MEQRLLGVMEEHDVRIAIFGTGGMGREAADLCRSMTGTEIIFVRDDPSGPVDGIEVIAPAEMLPEDRLVFAVGSTSDRRALAERFPDQVLGSIISRTAIVSPSATVGEGSVVCDYSVVNNGATIGKHFQANVFSQVSHDCVIGDYVTFSPRVSCNGWVCIEDDVFIGAGAVIRNGTPERRLKVGRGAVIGMGAVVTADVPPMAKIFGVPAKQQS
jgi:sugar O-acyltransferase (sialic acid O-acetyltransferase NeuD family)